MAVRNGRGIAIGSSSMVGDVESTIDAAGILAGVGTLSGTPDDVLIDGAGTLAGSSSLTGVGILSEATCPATYYPSAENDEQRCEGPGSHDLVRSTIGLEGVVADTTESASFEEILTFDTVVTACRPGRASHNVSVSTVLLQDGEARGRLQVIDSDDCSVKENSPYVDLVDGALSEACMFLEWNVDADILRLSIEAKRTAGEDPALLEIAVDGTSKIVSYWPALNQLFAGECDIQYLQQITCEFSQLIMSRHDYFVLNHAHPRNLYGEPDPDPVFSQQPLPMQVILEPQEDDLSQWGIDEKRDALVVMSRSLVESMGVFPKIGDRFNYSGRQYQILKLSSGGSRYFNTQVPLHYAGGADRTEKVLVS